MPTVAHVRAFEDQVEVVATLDVGAMWVRLRGEFLNRWAQLERQGLSADEIDRELVAFMESLSINFEQDIARKASGQVYNQGRGAEMRSQHAAGTVIYAVRSEVLDSATCASCAQLDGLVVEIGTSEYKEFMPPNKCEGGDRCRGFYVPVVG